MENNFKIIEATKESAQDIYSIEQDIENKILSLQTIHKELDDKNHIYFVAYENSTPLSYLASTVYIDHIDLDSIATKKAYRRKKIATFLLDILIKKASALDIDTIFLEVNENNHAAICFYENYGFKYVSTRKNYYKNGENAHIYCYTI